MTANNRQAAGALADLISDGWETPFRATRIREMITLADRKLSAQDVHRMQLDVKDVSALRYRDRAIAAARATSETRSLQLLEEWDGRALRASAAAAVYYLYVDRLRTGLARSLYGDSTGWLSRSIVDDVLETRAVPWPSRHPTSHSKINASFDSISRVAMKEASALANGRSWGDLHRVTAEHALGSVAALDRVLDLNIGNDPADGSQTTVNVSHWSAVKYDGASPLFGATAGASQRHVVDMADVDRFGGFILPGGQSGLPFADAYDDQWQRWLEGGLSPIPLDKRASAARALHTMRLLPRKVKL